MNTKVGKKNVSQAVVLADDFTQNLAPMDQIYPSVLMPIINIPLLDYLIETIVKSRIQELFLYCSSHVDLLKAYVQERKSTKLSISLIISDGCRSLGDALRDIDTKGWIRGNFILIRGNAFINVDLKNALNMHCDKIKADKGAAMTMLLKNLGSTSNSALKKQTALVVSDKFSKKLLHYVKLNDHEKKVKLELNWFLDHSEIEINTCYLDSHVYVCSPAVLPLFSDNFDFQTMEDFIKGVLMNEEILDSRIYWQELNAEDYGLPIVSWNAYHLLNRDILQRHSFPLTPTATSCLRNFIYMPRSTYKHKTSTLAKGCVLEKDSILGKDSTIGNDTFVTSSVIGDNCTVGSNVKIQESYILSNISIQANCSVLNSVIFPNCTLKENAQINGCILCPGVVINEGMQYTDSILSTNGSQTHVKKILDLDENTELEFFKNADLIECNYYSTDSSSSDENSERNSPIPDDTNMFLSEVIDSLLRGYQDKLNCENLILEINSSRYAYNVSMREVTYNVIKAILSLPLHYLSELKESVNNQNYQRNLKVMVTYFQSIISNYVKTGDAQEDCLRAIEEVATTTSELLPFVQHLLHLLYNRDVLSEEKILEWYESNDKEEDEFQSREVRNAVQPFIKWLQEAEEDSSESEDD